MYIVVKNGSFYIKLQRGENWRINILVKVSIAKICEILIYTVCEDKN
jgi:hypothetical protein